MNGDKNTPKELHNKWLACKSQSRPGVSYYFNSVTGESVWDLSEIEKAKAKEFTKTLPATSLQNCTEPKVSPRVNSGCVNQRQTAGQFCSHSEMNPHGASGGSFPSNIWATPPNAPVLPNIPGQFILVPSTLLPTVAPLITQPNMNYVPQQTQPSHSMPQQNEYHKSRPMPQKRQYMPTRGLNNRGRGVNRQNSRPYSNTFNNAPDLRSKLIQRRRKSQSHHVDNWDDSHSPIDYDGVNNKNWDNYMEDTPSKYDLSKVKQLNSNPERRNWFVVVDIDILVNEFQFLDRFTNPDQNCYLLVPDHVMCELQARAAGLDEKVKRIKRFLTEQIDLKHAFKGEDVSDRARDDCDKTLATCLDWAEQDNVILLSNDTKFDAYKQVSNNIHVLTMSHLKYILTHGPRQETIAGKSLSLADIKIVVPNDNSPSIKKIHLPEKNPSPEKAKDVVSKAPVKESSPEPIKASISQNMIANNIDVPKPNVNETDSTFKSAQDIASSSSSAQTNSLDCKKKIKLRRGWHRKPRPQEPNPAPNVTQASPQKSDVIPEEKIPERQIISQPEPITSHDDSSKSSTKTNNSTHSFKERRSKMRKEVVMYEVENEVMEEVLRLRRDEWVIQFVQIMEEVLRLKLMGNSGLHLHEAVKCVIQKYFNDVNVVDAANSLSSLLYEIRDDTGNIKSNIEPYEYMEMYSYGMYLIETLKDVSNNCEDLNTAHESLEKLLSDIKKTNLDNSQDSFIETDYNEAEIVPKPMAEAEKPSSPTIPTEVQKHSLSSNVSCTSFTGTFAEQQTNEPQQICPEKETSFFSNLKLRKKFQDTKLLESHDMSDNDDNSNERKLPLSPKSLPASPNEAKAQETEQETTNKINANQNDQEKNQFNTNIRIARNFVSIPKYEMKFQNKIDPKENRDKFIQDTETEEKKHFFTESVHQETMDICEKQLDETRIKDDSFKIFIQKFVGEMRGMLQNVIIHCSNTVKELDNQNQGNGNSTSIDFGKLEKTDTFLSELTEALASILDRNNNSTRKNLWQQDPKMADYIPSETIISQYSEAITGLKKQVDLIRNTITLILNLAPKT